MVVLTQPKLLVQLTDREVVLDALKTRIIYLRTLLTKTREELKWDVPLEGKTPSAKKKLKKHIRALKIELSYTRATKERIVR